MATPTQTDAERQAAAKSLQARTAVRTLRRKIDAVVERLTDDVTELAIDHASASLAVGGDSTRPYYSDDLGYLLVQRRRFEALRDALKAVDK